MSLNKYTTLGRSGLRVSPLCLGTMTFGTEWGWGAEETVSRDMFNRYRRCGRKLSRYSRSPTPAAIAKNWSGNLSRNEICATAS